MRITRILGFTIVLSIVTIILVQGVSAKWKADTSCPWFQTIAKFKKVVVSNKGDLEPIHINQGLAVLVTAKTSRHVKAIQKAAIEYIQEFDALPVQEGNTPCQKIMNAIRGKKITESITDTSNGVLVTLLTQDPSLVPMLHKSGCCNYCVCPSNSWRCNPCC